MQRIVFIVFFFIGIAVHAQQTLPILSDEDTTDLYNAMHTPQGEALISSQEQAAINDSLTKAGYALKRLKDVINMKKDILWASTLSQRIRDFQDSTFILVSPLMKVQGTGVLIGLVSRVGEINLFDPIDPYVTLYWKINPVTNLEMPFRLQLQVEHGAMLPDSLFADIELAIQTYYAGKIYENVDETEDDIVGATIEFLDLLEAKVGDRYAPKYMFKVDGHEYRSGHSMSIYEHVANQVDTVVSIYLIDRKSKATVQTTIDWNGAEVEAYHAFVDKDSIGTHTITATIDSADYVFTVTLIGDDVLNVISQSILSVFEAALVDAMQILADSAQAREDEYQHQKGLSDAFRKQMMV